MELKIDVDEARIEWLIKEVMQNYPEASSPSLQCIKWRYDDCYFEFEDVEEVGADGKPPIHIVNYDTLRKGFEVLMKTALGMIPGERFAVSGWDPNSLYYEEEEAWHDWACDWDADVVDGLVQCAIFGKVIYG